LWPDATKKPGRSIDLPGWESGGLVPEKPDCYPTKSVRMSTATAAREEMVRKMAGPIKF
jgi:hypothetical protein